MIELTRDDFVAIRNALGERFPIDERDQAIYRAGMAAMAERAAKVCDDATTDADKRGRLCYSQECAAAIRALLK
jgi:hypothetical protein